MVRATSWLALFIFALAGQAKDLGVQGHLFPILEPHTLHVLRGKLKGLEKSGRLQQWKKEVIEEAKRRVQRPKAISLPAARVSKTFLHDPTLILSEDIRDQKGRLLHPKGTRVNPLEHMTFTQVILFLDGDDEKQRQWALRNAKSPGATIILTKGAPLELSKKWKIPVFFDQEAVLVKKLKITHLPARVSAKGHVLQIEQIALKEEKEK